MFLSLIFSQQKLFTHTHPFIGPLSMTTQVSRYQKNKTNLDFTEARDREWQWHQLGHMQVCTLLQTDNHHSVFYRPDALPAIQPTVSKHRRQISKKNYSPKEKTQQKHLHTNRVFCFTQSVVTISIMNINSNYYIYTQYHHLAR